MTQCRTELSAWTVYLARQGLNDVAEREWESRAGDTPVFGDVIDLATNLDSQSQTLGAAAASNTFASDLGTDCSQILAQDPGYAFSQLGVPGGPTPSTTATTSAPPTTTNTPSFPVTQPSEASQCPTGVPATLIDSRYQGNKVTVLAAGCFGSNMQVFFTVDTQVMSEDFQEQSGTWNALSPPAGVGGATCDPFIPASSLMEIDKQTGYGYPSC